MSVTTTKKRVRKTVPIDEIQNERIDNIQTKIGEMSERVFNGLGKEIREEVKKEIDGVRFLVISVLISMLLGLTGIIIEGRLSTNQSAQENTRNYKAILDIQTEIQRLHPEAKIDDGG